MSKITIASLVKIANELDEIQLSSFADDVENVARLLTAQQDIDDQIENKQQEYTTLETVDIPDAKIDIKKQQDRTKYLEGIAAPNAAQVLFNLRKMKKQQEQGMGQDELMQQKINTIQPTKSQYGVIA